MIITKYKLFENEFNVLITEELMKSMLDTYLFNEEVKDYFLSYNFPFYPSNYDYNFEINDESKIETIYELSYIFTDSKLGAVTKINFKINEQYTFYKLILNITVNFDKFTPYKEYRSDYIYNCYMSYIINKTVKKGKESVDKQNKTLITEFKSSLKKIVKDDVLKYGANLFSIKDLIIAYRLIKKLEEIPFVEKISYTEYKNTYKNRTEIIQWKDNFLKTIIPTSYKCYDDNILLYFDYYSEYFIFNEMYYFHISKIYKKIKEKVKNEFNN